VLAHGAQKRRIHRRLLLRSGAYVGFQQLLQRFVVHVRLTPLLHALQRELFAELHRKQLQITTKQFTTGWLFCVVSTVKYCKMCA
jgi:hypothetical protein